MTGLSPGQKERMCPACKIKYRLAPQVTPNYSVLPVDRKLWLKLRDAAECFDRAASNLDEEEGWSGAGDGETRFTAREFIDWIKTDCTGFRDYKRADFDGAPARTETGLPAARTVENVHRHPFPLPQVEGVHRRAG